MALQQKLKHWAKEIALTALLVLIIANVLSYLRAPHLQNNQLPEINTLLLNQELYSTLDYRDKPLLIHFWATWCPTCKLEVSNIQALSEQYNVLTVAVKSGDDKHLNAYLHEHELTFKVINDKESILSQAFSVTAFPTTFIYDKNSTLAFCEVGYTSSLGLRLRMWWAGR